MGEVNAPGNGQGENQFDYEKSYNELRPEFTRVTQELSQAKQAADEYSALFAALQDPETRGQALELLGFELETGEPQGGNGPQAYTDPLEEEVTQLRGQVDELRSQRASEQAAREQEQFYSLRNEYIGEVITDIENNLRKNGAKDFTFSTKDEVALGNLAISMQNEEGLPDVQGAYDTLFGNDGIVESRRQTWIDSKLSAPTPPPISQLPADQRPTDKRSRIAYVDERLAQLERQQ